MGMRRVHVVMQKENEMTQCEKILKYIKEQGSITPLDAMREFSCMRLASRITDLKKAGYKINSEMVTSKNKYGENVRYAMYTLSE